MDKIKAILILLCIVVASIPFIAYAESINFSEILPEGFEQKRALCYNYDTACLPSDWDDVIGIGGLNGTSDFSVEIPVKNGDYVEVTFLGSIIGYTMSEIVLSQGSAAAIYNSFVILTWSPLSHSTWDSYILKGLYSATADCTLIFKKRFWRSTASPVMPTTLGVGEVNHYATAEIINAPVYSP